jgi:hypothetical protein
MTAKRVLGVVVIALLLAGLAMASEFPAGTKFTVRTGQELNSGSATAGQSWNGTLAQDVVVDGKTLAKSGAPVVGKVTSAKSSGRLKAPGILTVRLTSVDGKAVRTTAVGRKGKGHTKSNVTKIGGGAAAGALIGGLAGGGKGAAIGSLAGAGAGTGVAMYTGKMEATIPAEATLTFTATAPAVTAKK